jgi:y4mF family transcriptional regulator
MVRQNDPDREQVIARFVEGRRRANKMTQAELGELAGVGRRLIVDIERGKPTLRMDSVNAVLAVFGKVLGLVDMPRREMSK